MLKKILNLGVNETQTVYQQKRLRLINGLSLLNILINTVGLFYIFIIEKTAQEQIFHTIIALLVHALFLYFNFKGRIATTISIIKVFLVLSTLSLFILYNLDLYIKVLFAFGAFGFANVISDSRKEVKFVLISFSSVIVLGSYLHFAPWYNFVSNFDYQNNLAIQGATIFLIALTLYYSVMLKSEAISYHKELEKALAINKQQNKDLQRTLGEKEILVAEINHRVKNNLELILSILELQLDKVKDPNSIQALLVGVSRIKSMASLHELLNEKSTYTTVNLKTYFEQLTHKIIDLHPQQNVINLEQNLVDYSMNAQQALALGLIFNEVITNSMQHSVTESRTNHFSLQSYFDEDYLIVRFKDSGKINTLNFKENLGHKLIELLTKQLQADLQREIDNGLSTTLKLKITTS